MTNWLKSRFKQTKWKHLFFILLSLNGLILLLLIAFILWPATKPDRTLETPIDEQESSEFIIRTTKGNLNDLINAYLDQWLAGSPHQYSISLEEDVHLQGELPVFSTTVPLSARLEPIVQNNGDVVLKLRSLSIGLLELPNKRIMQYMNNFFDVPEWVQIDPNEEEIYLAITSMEFESNFQIAAEQIDLDANNIAIKITVPYETLGIHQIPQ